MNSKLPDFKLEEKAPPQKLVDRIAEEMLKVSNGGKTKLSEKDFLTALETPEFDVISDAFGTILLTSNVARKLQRLNDHNYLCCGLMVPSIYLA